jgi:hypothetical protein
MRKFEAAPARVAIRVKPPLKLRKLPNSQPVRWWYIWLIGYTPINWREFPSIGVYPWSKFPKDPYMMLFLKKYIK